MVRDFSIDLWFCAFILGGSSLASHILAVQLTFELEVRQTRYKNEKNATVIVISAV